ncbi:MAG: SCP2 domain-containing protein [Aliivibrio sp.]|uniref:ubiquinone anaerobic biosynthesis accessory factor UbiT n=1 Tax=Aliivibrio sp. TaxID=1872443 RepID=UPI001A3C4DD2|nr:SCP2 domain-containing protein [Aliivibrio sp.]
MINKLKMQLVHNAPPFLRSAVQFLPSTLQNRALFEALKQVFKEALEDGDFEFLEQRWLKISVLDLHLHWYISYQNEQLIVSNMSVVEDVSFSGNLNDLILIAGRKEDPDSLFFKRRLKIEGDTELGLEVKNLMDSVDLDALPKPMLIALNHLATFIQQNIDMNEEKGTQQHAF